MKLIVRDHCFHDILRHFLKESIQKAKISEGQLSLTTVQSQVRGLSVKMKMGTKSGDSETKNRVTDGEKKFLVWEWSK